MKIKPFKALRYDISKVSASGAVLCPPYDVINPEQRVCLQKEEPHNMVHLILPQESAGFDKYESSARLMKEWISKGILAEEDREAVYFYRQTFTVDGKKHSRLGFIALLGLESSKGVFPHEHTNAAPKEDRLKLMRSVRANLSPIFVLFEDPEKLMSGIFSNRMAAASADISFTDRDGILNELWCLKDKAALDILSEGIGKKNIFIADGHHRFEVANLYLKEARQKDPALPETAPENFVMAYFTDTAADNLVILPIHRILSKVDKTILGKLKESLGKYFDLKDFSDLTQARSSLEAAAGKCAFLMARKGEVTLLTLKNEHDIASFLPSDRSPEYRRLDVAVFNHIILKHILGIDMMEYDKISYSHNVKEGLAAVDSGEADIFFILNPVKIEQMLKVAQNSEKMPPKSTFFYPKILTGLAIHKF